MDETVELFVPASSEPNVSLRIFGMVHFSLQEREKPLTSPVMALPLVSLEDYATLTHDVSSHYK